MQVPTTILPHSAEYRKPTELEQRVAYKAILEQIDYNLASLEIHRAQAHMPPGPVPEVITNTDTAINTTIDALRGIANFTHRQSTAADAMLTAYTALTAGSSAETVRDPAESSPAAS